ncbi:hypothetical protein ACFGWE_03735 [Pasteurella multocida]
MQTEWGKKHQGLMTANAAKTTKSNSDEKRSHLISGYDRKMYTAVYKLMNSAKTRCRNENSKYFHNYGGRGITFDFESPKQATIYVLNHLGPRPSKNHSIDRINNDAGYKPGNLRWATRRDQANNKREYKRTPTGERIRYLQNHTDYSYESIRTFIKQGMTDEEITSKRKYRTGV